MMAPAGLLEKVRVDLSRSAAETKAAAEDHEVTTEDESAYSHQTVMSVVHEVEDFARWHAGYEEKSDPEARISVYVNVDNPGEVTVFEFTKSHEDAMAFIQSDDIKKAMEEFGVTSEPLVTLLDMKYLNLEEDPIGKYRVAIRHEVSDYTAWKEQFDADAKRRTDAGLQLRGLATSSDNPNMVNIFFATDNIETVKTMLADPGLKKVMEDAGVISEPDVVFLTAPESI
jgi:hypothetical protein